MRSNTISNWRDSTAQWIDTTGFLSRTQTSWNNLEPPYRARGCPVVPHPISWTHVCARRPGVARTPRALRSASDSQASQGASSGCTARRSRRRRHARRRDAERLDRRSLAPCERAVPPLRDAVRFGFLEEAEAGTDAPVPDLMEEVVRQILAAMVHPQGQPAGDVGVHRAVPLAKAVRDGFEGGEPVADLAHVPPDALRVPVVDRREGPDPAVVHRERPHAVGPPHNVRRRGDDGPVVELRIALAPAVGREQPVRAHHALHSGPGDADPVQDPQPRVHLPMTLALERRARKVRSMGRPLMRPLDSRN